MAIHKYTSKKSDYFNMWKWQPAYEQEKEIPIC